MSDAALGPMPTDAAAPRFSSSPYEPARPPITSLDQIDLLDPALYQCGDPHAAWTLLRREAPVFWHKRSARGTDDNGFWALTRYDDIISVYRNSEVFSSEDGPFLDLRAEDTPRRILASIDGRPHRMRRSLVARLFTPQAIAQWADMVRATVNGLLDRVEGQGGCDFSQDIAHPLPMLATCELLGVSAADAQRLGDMLFAMDAGSMVDLDAYNRATLQFFLDISKERRRKGMDGAMIDVVNKGTIDGENISDEDIAELLWVLFFGGIDSTVHAVTGGLLSLFQHPDQLDLLRADPSLAVRGIDEILRWTSTSHANKRRALQDTEIRGVTIKAGDFVSLWLPSANRDEEVFEDPFRFDLLRQFDKTKPIATFGGGGPHQCIGQFFAKLEVQILFEELLKRFPNISPAGPAERTDHFTILLSPIKHLPVQFAPVH